MNKEELDTIIEDMIDMMEDGGMDTSYIGPNYQKAKDIAIDKIINYKKQIKEEWCTCEGEQDSKGLSEAIKCHETSNYVKNGLCPCGTYKHHYHGGICGKITQIG